jgi:hypothetical protein
LTPNVTSVVYSQTAVNDLHVLESAGYRVRGHRADCPYCEGHARLTVSIHDDLFYCHRCHRGGSTRQLARAQGLKLPPPRIGLARLQKRWFGQWLSEKMTEMATRERQLYRQASYARACLTFYPNHQQAWQILKEWFAEQPKFERFWELASDRLGRLRLYKYWRRRNRGR